MNKTLLPTKREEMTALRRPLDMFDELRTDMASFFDRSWPTLFPPFARHMAATTEWVPRLDAYEKDGELVVKAELPGVKKENVHVELLEGDLVIRGERAVEKEIKEELFYRNERSVGAFYRRLPLAFEADAKLIAANFKDGVLEVKLPIVEKPAKVNKIAIT